MQITAYEIVMILHAVKLSRITQSPMNSDHYVDGISYLAFASEFLAAEIPPAPITLPPKAPEMVAGRPVVHRVAHDT